MSCRFLFLASLATFWLAGLAACAPATAMAWPTPAPTFHWPGARPTEQASAQADSVTLVLAGPMPGNAPHMPGDEGLAATARDDQAAIGSDPTGAKTQAHETLLDFINPLGPYRGAWWFGDDGRADLYEVLAVILYTEGNTSFDVRSAVAARYLWYCGGTGTTCQGAALLNFLSYFQPWREPWISRGFASHEAQRHLDLAKAVVNQDPGLLTAMIPGADTYRASRDGLSGEGSIDWNRTLFHFANVHATWDRYLREELRRLANGPARLWVLTMNEAGQVCGSPFICQDMTQARH